MDKVTLVTIHNAFDRTGRDTKQVESGLSLEEMQTLYLPASIDFAISVNGRPVDHLDIVPRAGDMVVALPILTGGNDGAGKLILKLLVSVVIAIAAVYTAGWAAALYGPLWGAMAGAAVTMVGGLLVNMAFSPTAPGGGALQTRGEDANSSPAYSWSPQSTQQQGIVLPRWYGKNKLYGNIILAHVEYVGANSYVNVIIDLGLGPFNSISDYQINDQPIANFIGIQPPSVTLGYVNQPVLNDFKEAAVEYTTSRLVAYGVPVIYTTQGNDFDGLEILLQFPRGLAYYNDAGGLSALTVNYRVSIKEHDGVDWTVLTLTPYQHGLSPDNHWSAGYWPPAMSSNKAWVECFVGGTEYGEHYEGEPGPRMTGPLTGPTTWHWIGTRDALVTSIHDYGIATEAQTTPIRITVHGVVNNKTYYDIKVERLTPDFTTTRYIGELYLASVKEITNQAFTYPRQALVGIKALATNQLSGSLRFSCIAECALLRVWNGTSWNTEYSTNPAWICFDILTQPVLAVIPKTWDFTGSLLGWVGQNGNLVSNTNSMTYTPTSVGSNSNLIYIDPLTLNGATYGVVKIRIKRISGSTWQGLFYGWAGAVTSFAAGVPEPTWTGDFVEIVVDMSKAMSQQYPIAYWATSTITRFGFNFSTNLNDVFEIDSVSIGDGSVPVLRYDGIDPTRIDHVKFLEWANYCDELLSDGSGGTEKRIEFNGGFDSEMTLWEAVLRVCSNAYAVPVWNGIKLTVSIDKPADPVQLFSLGNIDQDSFKENFLPMEDRAAEIEVDFVNEENNYQRDKLMVVNAAMTTVTSKVNLSLFGITKPSMAWRNAMRRLAYNQFISRTIEFGADIDSIACTIGDVILVQHDVPQWGYGGRIVSATTTAITIDQTITLETGTQYAILVRMADDSLVERDITNAPGDATVLTVSPAFAAAPVQFDVFTVGEILKTAKPFRVSNIDRTSELKAQISAVEYVEGIYNVDYDIPAVGALDYTLPLTSYKQSLPPFESVVGLTVSESLRKYNSGQVSAIATIFWTPTVNRYAFPSVEVWAWQDGTAPQKISNNPITADSFEWPVVVDGIYWNFAVAVVNLNGESQAVSGLVPFRKFIYGKTAPPADVTDFYATPVITGGLRFTWATVPDLDVLEYVIKYSPLVTGASWFGASELIRTSANYTNLNAALTGTYLIKAIDTTGNESVNTDSLTVTNVPIQVNATPYAVITEHPAWSGTKTDFSISSGTIYVTGADPSGNTGIYTAATTVDFGSVKTARVSAKCDWLAVATADWDSITDIDSLAAIDTPTGKSGLQIFITTSQDGSAPSYKQPLFAGDFTFQRAIFSIEAYEQQPDNVTVSGLTINVDIHDIVITI